MSDNVGNFRSAVLNEPMISSGTAPGVVRTPLAMGSQLPPSLPPLPPPVGMGVGSSALGQSAAFGYNSNPYMSGMGYGGGYGGGFGFGGSGFGTGFGSGYGGGYGGYGSSFGRFGLNPADPEQRFIQLAENSSRGAFQSIESVVGAIGNIASMLDSTFFALTSSFRAVLGVAANFGRLRTVFAQFWHTFAVFRGLNWIYRKMLYWLRISNIDPSSVAFREAFAAAVAAQSGTPGPALPKKGPSPWPVVAFISFIFTAPYLIMKLVGTVTETALEETRNPAKWINPIETTASYDFQARNPSELSFQAGQRVVVAPKEIQNTHHLLNTGWGLATIDGNASGLVPITYLKSPSQLRQQVASPIKTENPSTLMEQPQPQLPGLGVSDFTIAPQPIGGGSDFTNRTIPISTENTVGEMPTQEL